MNKRKSLSLVISVSGTDPDGQLRRILSDPGGMQLRGCCNDNDIGVDTIRRADGQQIGLESEFEDWWHDSHCEGDAEEETPEKSWARDAFLYGVKFAGSK